MLVKCLLHGFFCEVLHKADTEIDQMVALHLASSLLITEFIILHLCSGSMNLCQLFIPDNAIATQDRDGYLFIDNWTLNIQSSMAAHANRRLHLQHQLCTNAECTKRIACRNKNISQ